MFLTAPKNFDSHTSLNQSAVMEGHMSRDVILIHPPLWDMYAPPAATPALVGHLRTHGFSAAQIDLNQIYFRDICDHLLGTALRDATDEATYNSKLPYEHKVVLRAMEFTPNLLE